MEHPSKHRLPLLSRRTFAQTLLLLFILFVLPTGQAFAFQPSYGKPPPPPTSSSPVAQLLVDQDGLYRVTHEALLAAGFNFGGVRTTDLALTLRGVAVPLRIGGPSKFGAGSYVEFFGQAVDSLYTRTNVYVLSVNRKLASRVAVDTRTLPSSYTTPAVYLEKLVVDNNLVYSEFSTGEDPWYDTEMLAYKTPVTWYFPFTMGEYQPGYGSSPLAITVWGGTSWSPYPDHHLTAAVNGLTVADGKFDGATTFTLNGTIPDGVLQSGANTLSLTLPGDLGVDWDLTYLDKFEITYPRPFLARDGRLSFQGSAAAFQVDSFTSPNVVAYRVSGGTPVFVQNLYITGSGIYQATFPGTSSADTYWVSAVEALRTPGLAAPRAKADITSGKASYLVISHPDFLNGLGALVSLRQAAGYTVRVVNVFDVYAQYSSDVVDPQAIKDYLSYAYQTMDTQYVLLVGGDSYDYFNYLGYGSQSYIPTIYAVSDYYNRFAPADPLYADVNGDGVPEMAIGRLPVRTVDELNVLIQKIQNYEAKTYAGSAVFSADAGFSSSSEAMVNDLPPGWSVRKAYLDNLPVNDARSILISNLNEGVALANYTGHSSPEEWTYSGLFTTNDAAGLANARRPAVVAQWGCLNTYFVDPLGDDFAQTFLLSGDRGAAAVIGSTATSYLGAQDAFANLVMPRLVTPGMTIGAAMRDAKLELASTSGLLPYIHYTWTLLGDPALVVQP